MIVPLLVAAQLLVSGMEHSDWRCSWPATRSYHTAVSLHEADGGATNPALLVMWGADDDDILSDGWIFTVNAQQWRKVGGLI